MTALNLDAIKARLDIQERLLAVRLEQISSLQAENARLSAQLLQDAPLAAAARAHHNALEIRGCWCIVCAAVKLQAEAHEQTKGGG